MFGAAEINQLDIDAIILTLAFFQKHYILELDI